MKNNHNDHNDQLDAAKAVVEKLQANAVTLTVSGYGAVTLVLELGTREAEGGWGNGPWTTVRAAVPLTRTQGEGKTHPTMDPAWGPHTPEFQTLRRKVEDRIRKDAEAALKCAAILGIK